MDSAKEKFSETSKTKPLKIALKIDYHKVGWQILHSIVSVSKKDLAKRISLKLSSDREVCLTNSQEKKTNCL